MMIRRLFISTACLAAISSQAGEIYWTTWDQGVSDGVYRATTDGNDVSRIISYEDLVPENFSHYVGLPMDLAVDATGGHIYLVETETDTIWRTDPAGTTFTELLAVEGEDPHQLEVDLENGLVYWIEDNGPSSPARIGRCELDGTNPGYLVDDAGVRAGGLALDVRNGHLFWTESYAGPEVQLSVWRSDLDGGNAQRIVSTFAEDTFELGAITVDPVAQTVYWIQDQRLIRVANHDGTQAGTLVEESGLGDRSHLALDPANETLYWTGGYGGKTVGRVNLPDAVSQPFIEGLPSNPMGIFVDAAGTRPRIQLGGVSSENLTVSWIQPSGDWQLEMNLTLDPNGWSPVPTNQTVLDGSSGTAVLDATLDRLFLRLNGASE